jgi:hypothetical protein
MSNLAEQLPVQLNDDTYYSQQANMKYMSVSQYKSFLSCEAATMAELRGEYEPYDKESLIAGNYLHAWNEGTLEDFKQKYAGVIYNKKGEPYAPFKKVNDMIEVLENDEMCMLMLQGTKEAIIVAEFADVEWKIKMDVLNREQGFFTDLKSTRSITELHYSEQHRQRVSFIEEYDYMVQAAVYAEVERIASGNKDWLTPMMVAVSKEDPPDKSVITLADNGRLNLELDKIEQNLPRIIAVKNGYEKANRCEKCRYCRMTKRVDRVITYLDLGGTIYGARG